jgi:chlorobactene glucosyltransferase
VLIVLHIVILVALGVMAGVTLLNLLTFRSVKRSLTPETTPFVSVLVPARNEERNIARCLKSLLGQDYPHYEVIALDDSSSDATLDIARSFAANDRRLRLLEGKPLPEGWTGKSFACYQLSQEAKGELLLFVDADTEHTPHSISSAVAEMQRSRVDLLTLIPRQIMGTFWEKAILPLLHFSTFCFLPFPLVRLSKNPKFAMANGQFMLFKRRVYDTIGGHKEVRTALVEDVWLSRLVKQHGFRLLVMDGSQLVSCRMYTSLRGIWEGFSRNLFPGMRYSVPMIVAVVVFNFLTSVLPFLLLLLGLASYGTDSWWSGVVVTEIAVIVAIRVALALRFHMSLPSVFIHPVAMSVLMGIAVNSVRLVLVGGGSRWKGRAYDFRKQVVIETITR